MNNRERQWYEGKYGRHPSTCNCVDCVEQRRVSMREEDVLLEEQGKKQEGVEERVGWLKKWIRKVKENDK